MQAIGKLAIGFCSKLSKILTQCVKITEERTVYAAESKNLMGSGFPQLPLLTKTVSANLSQHEQV